jgi:aspartate/methionine/tyrosine aminotransferase
MTATLQWNPALDALPYSGIRRMFNTAAQMKDVIHLSIGQPDFPTPPHIIDAHVAALREGKTAYTLDAGLPDLLAGLAESYSQRHGLALTPDHFVQTSGGSEAVFLAITSIAAPGREVICIEPSFVLFKPVARYAGAEVRTVVTTAAQGYQVDPQEVIDAITPRTAAVILNSPGNPTGTVYPAETIAAICQAAAKRGVVVISDEVYDRLLLDGGEYPSALTSSPDPDLTIVASSFSKTYAIPGLRIGYLISSPSNIATLRRYHMYTTTVGNTPGQIAAAAALRGPQDSVDAMVAEYRRRRDRIVELVGRVPQLRGYRPQGAFYIMPSLPEGTDSSEVAMRLLKETGVCTVPGDTFGESCRNTLRISFATALDKIEAAFERMTPWFARQSF